MATRRVRYAVATSLDGFIAGPNDEHDWIVMDPEIDFEGMMAQFDTYLVGRRTFDGFVKAGQASGSGPPMVVFSRTLDPENYPGVRIVSDGLTDVVRELKAEDGKDIWLFGGGSLFRSLVERELVDTIEVGIIPVLLGEGVRMMAHPGPTCRLALTKHGVLPNSGIVNLEYDIRYEAA